jgi:hypothetical protein
MTAIVITIYCLLAVMLMFGVTFHHEWLNDKRHKKG